MRKRIPSERIKKIWRKKHARTKLPSVKAYFAPKKELNKIADTSQQGKGKFSQNTKKEYGKHKAISSYSHNIRALVYRQGKSRVILVVRDTKAKVNKALSHELEHIYKKEA